MALSLSPNPVAGLGRSRKGTKKVGLSAGDEGIHPAFPMYGMQDRTLVTGQCSDNSTTHTNSAVKHAASVE